MTCPYCGHENLPDARFCAQCGNKLEQVCPVCSAVSPLDARFCSNCGHAFAAGPRLGEDVTRYVPPEMLTKITTARASNTMRGERRTVTMLFADIQGSTAAAEGLDPEDWTEIINGAFEHLIEPVYRYEGTLARLMGDAVLAFFGAPIAHEDDPVRAVHAGLDIIEAMAPYKAHIEERWGIAIDVRVGINTGLVVVGEVGSDLRVEYTALGDAVNVAARMEQTAQPGTVRVTAHTWSLVEGHFDGEEIGPVEVKGKSDPVAAVRVVGRASQTPVAAGARPLLGRSAELEALESLRSRLVDGAGWVVSLIGEAGVGKSRLLEAFRETATAATDAELGSMSAFNQSYDASNPYSSLRQLLSKWWRLDDADEPFRVVEKSVEAAAVDHPDTAAYLGYVASVPLPDSVSEFVNKLETPVLHARVRQAVIAYLEGEARRRPLLITMEDIHWADPLSLTLLEEVMQLTERAPLGLLFTMRPYRDEPPWHIHEVAQRDHPHRYHSFDLLSLRGETAERLLDVVLEGMTVSADVRRRILDRSDGNPLFLEQMAQALREGDAEVDAVTVPTGLSSLLTARLDRLEAGSRTVTQIASVIGTEFDRSMLSSLMGEEIDLGPHLVDLLRREILIESPARPAMMAFRHALMREAAYSTMLLRTRRELHGRVAEHLLATDPDAVQEIALHLVEAGDAEKAFPHLIAAGERSTRAMALADAIHFFTTALDRIPAGADADLVVRAHDGLGVAYTLVPDLTQSEATYQRLVDYADSSGRPSAKVTALNRLAMATALLGGDLPGAHRYLDQAFTLAEEVGDEHGLAEYHMNACTVAFMDGDVRTSVVHDSEIAKWGGKLGVDAIRLEGLTRLALNMVWLMDFEGAGPAVKEAVEAAREVGDEVHLALLDLALSRLRIRDGDMEGALRTLLDREETLIKYADFFAPLAGAMAGVLLFERGEFEAAITRLLGAREAAAQLPFFAAVAAAGLALVYASLGMSEQTSEARSAALEKVRVSLGGLMASTVWAGLGRASLAVGDLDTARHDFETGLALSSASMYWERPGLLFGRALVEGELGDHARAHSALDEAHTFLIEKEIRAYDAHLQHARGEVLLAEGRAQEAADHLEAARAAAAAGGWRVLAVRIAGAAARAATSLGDAESAARHVASARAEVADMAAAASDPDLAEAIRSALSRPLDQIPTA